MPYFSSKLQHRGHHHRRAVGQRDEADLDFLLLGRVGAGGPDARRRARQRGRGGGRDRSLDEVAARLAHQILFAVHGHPSTRETPRASRPPTAASSRQPIDRTPLSEPTVRPRRCGLLVPEPMHDACQPKPGLPAAFRCCTAPTESAKARRTALRWCDALSGLAHARADRDRVVDDGVAASVRVDQPRSRSNSCASMTLCATSARRLPRSIASLRRRL